MKTTVLTIILLFIAGSVIQAQNIPVNTKTSGEIVPFGNKDNSSGGSQSMSDLDDGGSRSFDSFGNEESMYLDVMWQPGIVVLANGEKWDDKKFRYNLYAKQMQFLSGNDTLAFGDPDEIKYLEFSGMRFIYTDYVLNGIEGKDYFEVISKGDNCRLLFRRVVKYHVNDEDKDIANDVFILSENYFLQKKGENALPVPLNKKCFLNVFGDKKDQVSKFVKKEGLNPKRDEDLKRIVDYYNSLD